MLLRAGGAKELRTVVPVLGTLSERKGRFCVQTMSLSDRPLSLLAVQDGRQAGHVVLEVASRQVMSQFTVSARRA